MSVPAAGYGDLGRLRSRVGRIVEVPALYRGGVDSTDRDRVAVGTPPVAAEAVHLLGGDEVGAAPRDRVGFVEVAAGEHPPTAVELADAQEPPAHVGDAARRGIGARVEHRSGDVEWSSGARDQAGHEQPAGEREGDDRSGRVGGVGRDAGRALAGALTPGPLLGGEVLVRRWVVAGEQIVGIGDESLLPGVGVGDPEAVDRVVAGAAAQEHDAPAVGRNAHVAGSLRE